MGGKRTLLDLGARSAIQSVYPPVGSQGSFLTPVSQASVNVTFTP